MKEKIRRENQRNGSIRRTQPTTVSFEDGGKLPQTKECGEPLEPGKGEKKKSPLEPPEKKFRLLSP